MRDGSGRGFRLAAVNIAEYRQRGHGYRSSWRWLGMGFSQHAGMVIARDGTDECRRAYSPRKHNDPVTGVKAPCRCRI